MPSKPALSQVFSQFVKIFQSFPVFFDCQNPITYTVREHEFHGESHLFVDSKAPKPKGTRP